MDLRSSRCLSSTLLTPLLFASLLTGQASVVRAQAQAQPLRLPTTDGHPPNGSTVWVGNLSHDGRFVIVSSDSTNFVAGANVACGGRNCIQVYVLDRDTDTDGIWDEVGAQSLQLVSRNNAGMPADADVAFPTINADGRFVLFNTYARSLDATSTFHSHLYLHDRQTRQTEVIDVSTSGELANDSTYYFNAISADGRVVAFHSRASNLVPGDTNRNCLSPPNCSDLFTRDRVTGRTTRVNISSTGTQTDRETHQVAISADGRFVTFSSDATTLVPGDTNGLQDVFVHDRVNGTTERVSLTSNGQQGDAPSFGQPRPAISTDGRLVIFTSDASNLPAGAAHDRLTRRTYAGCVDPSGRVSRCETPSLSADGRWLAFSSPQPFGPWQVNVRDLRTGRSTTVGVGRLEAISGDGRFLTLYADDLRGPAIIDLDRDADGLPDAWETLVGLSPSVGGGDDGGPGDPDGDGTTNAEEYVAATHPRGIFRQHFAEGATIASFATRLALLNPGVAPAHAQVTFTLPDGRVVPHRLTVGARRRVELDPRLVDGVNAAEFSTLVEADVMLVADRTMTWGHDAYGAHAESGVSEPAPTWYLAEGATHSGFDLFYLLQNPHAVETTVRVRYLRAIGPPLEKTYRLPPTSRTNIWVNVEEFPGLGAALANAEVSAVFETLDGNGLIVERAMYLSRTGRPFEAGHASAGVTAPRTAWFLAEGATGDYFDMFVLIANPHDQAAAVRMTYLLPDGRTFTKTRAVPAASRASIWVDQEEFAGVVGRPLADVAVSTTVAVLNDIPVVVERAQWWPGTSATWHEAHNAAGATETGRVWAVADAGVDPTRGQETYLLIANTSSAAGEVRVTLLGDDGASSARSYPLPGNSRTSVAVGTDFGAFPGRFGAIVESLGSEPVPIVVERAMYWDAGGQRWAAGTCVLATRLQ